MLSDYIVTSALKDYPIHTIKIDKKFVDDLFQDQRSKALFDGIVYLAKKLNLTIIIEGIEDLPTLNLVTKHNEVKIQGYYFYKPMSQKEFEELFV